MDSGLSPLQLSTPGFISSGHPDPAGQEEGGASFQVRDLGLLAHIIHSQGYTAVSELALVLVGCCGSLEGRHLATTGAQTGEARCSGCSLMAASPFEVEFAGGLTPNLGSGERLPSVKGRVI